jgi:ribosomal protein S27E
MAWIALHDGEEKGAFEVPFQTDAYCKECGGRLRVWRESTDGRARHFKHVSEMGGGRGGGNSSCSGGEGDKHRKWKNFAAERLAEVFDAVAEASVEKRIAAPHTDKEHRDADAIVLFEGRDDQLGLGLAVEVQHKNKDKDIEATTRDYLKQDIAVAWLYEEDFADDGCRMNETDFRDRAAAGISPLYFRNTPIPWDLHLKTHVEPKLDIVRKKPELLNADECDYELTSWGQEVPAKIPQDWFEKKSREIWEKQYWFSVFSQYHSHRNGVNRYASEEFFREVREKMRSEPPEITAKLPPEYSDQKARELWNQKEWLSLFSPPTEHLADIEPLGVSMEIDVAPFFGEKFWKQSWLRGKNPQGQKFAIPCNQCGEMIYPPKNGESVTKMLKFHVKREHKKKLKRSGSYSSFIKNDHAAKLDVNHTDTLL